VAEESTELVDTSSDELISRQLLMAEEGEDDGDLPIIKFDALSEDEATANAGDENDADREAWRIRNRARAARRRRVNERMRSMHRELDTEFTAVSERGFRTPVANITRVTTIEARLTVEWQAVVLDLSTAITTTMPAEVRPLAGGSSHLQGATRVRPIIGLLQKTCASESMKDAMRDP
jgi:hypothetical protein